MKLKRYYRKVNYDQNKKLFLEAVSKFNDFGKNIYREGDLKEVVESIKNYLLVQEIILFLKQIIGLMALLLKR